MKKHLVIPDPHCKVGVSNDRFTWAGKLAKDVDPDVIICLGDWVNMDSLSHFDRGTMSFENRRYQKEIDHAHDALERFNKAYGKKKRRMVMLGGNHEHRITRFVESNPELDGKMSVEDIGFEDFGWEYHPYEKPVDIDGILYCHHFPSGVLGKPISGEHIASGLLKKTFQSATVGHSHTWDHAVRGTPTGRHIMGLCAGCYLDHNEPYAKSTMPLWWKGLVVKHNVHNGVYDLSQYSIKDIRRTYGK